MKWSAITRGVWSAALAVVAALAAAAAAARAAMVMAIRRTVCDMGSPRAETGAFGRVA
jgi:hypothetical protein